ncbi:MAG: outer membrane beta-barrel protein [Cytophagaceae bacterium]|jgi:hypothetical protein|nr:outer membrane beta-barrel protein [Cytophagaceae bacterium]
MRNIKNFLVCFLIAVVMPATAQDAVNESTVSQEHKIKLSFQYGRFKANNSQFKRIQPGNSYGGDLSAFITSRFFVTAHFNCGINYYYEDELSNDPGHINYPNNGNTNATITMWNMGLTAGYQLPVTRWMNLSAQIGAAQILDLRSFPMSQPKEVIIKNLGSLTYTWYSLSFPIKFSIDFPVLKHLEVGFSYGFSYCPDYVWGVAGMYFGPHLSYVF